MRMNVDAAGKNQASRRVNLSFCGWNRDADRGDAFAEDAQIAFDNPLRRYNLCAAYHQINLTRHRVNCPLKIRFRVSMTFLSPRARLGEGGP